MKKIALFTVFCLLVLLSKAQIKPVDSLYLWVSFSEENIYIDVPESYFNYRSTIPVTPPNIKLRNMMVLVPPLPPQDKLMALLHKETDEINTLVTKEQKLKYLGKVVLLIWYSKSFKEEIPQNVMERVKQLNQTPEVKKEATLILNWLL